MTDFHVLPIRGCQIVLEVDWLKNFDAVTLSSKDQKIQAGKSWEFQGIQGGKSEIVQAELMDKTMYQSAKGWLIYACSKEDNSKIIEEEINPLLQSLCEKYAYIFKEVIGLPPQRSHDHQIP